MDLPEPVQLKIRDMPESSQGATRVVLILDDGTRIHDVYVAWGREVVKIGSTISFELDVSRVVDAELELPLSIEGR